MFKRITAKNLFSWKDLDYQVPAGISQITGWNFDDETAEGSGKSSIFNALCWVLYGKIPKDAKIDDVIREGQDTGQGSVELINGDSIIRGRKPNILKIIKENGTVVQGKDAKDTQLNINTLIGMDFDSFCQVVYFAQSYPRRFIAANEAEKAAVLSEIQDLAIFDRARKNTMEQIKANTVKQTALEKEQTALQADESKFISNAQLLAEFLGKFEDEKVTKLRQIDSDIAEQRAELTAAKLLASDVEAAESLSAAEAMLTELTRKRAECLAETKLYDQNVRIREQAERTIKDLRVRISRLAQDVEDNAACGHDCPTCGQAVPDTLHDRVFKKAKQAKDELATVTAQWKQATQDLKDLKVINSPEAAQSLIAEIDVEAKALQVYKKAHQEQVAKVTAAQARTLTLTKSIERILADKAALEAKQPVDELAKLVALDAAMGDLGIKLAAKAQDLKSIKTTIDNLNILKDGFREVKSYVFQSILAELSHKATAYANELFGISVKLRFHNEGEDGEVAKINTEITLGGVQRGLGLTSGGQYARLELAINLALSDIVANRSQNPIKFRIFDEPFKNMSETSMAKAVKLFENLEGTTILVEHNSLIKAIVSEVFHVEYRDKVSYAVQNVEMPDLPSATKN